MYMSRSLLAKAGSHRNRLVILGSGWGSYRLLKCIDANKYKCTVISPRNHFLFTPLLTHAAVGTAGIKAACQPVRPLCAKKNAKFYEARAQTVDKVNKIVQCQTVDGAKFSIPYDKLVCGVGFTANDFGMPQVQQYAHFFKDTADAAMLHDHILRKFELASTLHLLDGDDKLSLEEEKELHKQLSFVIVGAGPTGTELAGEMADFFRKDIFRIYQHLEPYIKIHLVDAAPTVLAPFKDAQLQAYAQNHLETKMNVKVHLNEFVSDITESTISFKSGNSIDFGTLIWCAGIKPIPFVKDLDVTKSKNGAQILTEPSLRVKGEESIFALGDSATIENYWLPQTAQVAKQQAVYLAKNLNSMSDAQLWKPFEFHSLGVMSSLGGYKSIIAQLPIGNQSLTGFIAWLGWRSVYWSQQLSMRNRFMLFCDWVGTLVFGRDLMRKGRGSKELQKWFSEP